MSGGMVGERERATHPMVPMILCFLFGLFFLFTEGDEAKSSLRLLCGELKFIESFADVSCLVLS